MASSTQRTEVWANSERQWRTGKPGMLQSMELQRARHDWVTEQQSDWKAKTFSLTLWSLVRGKGLETAFNHVAGDLIKQVMSVHIKLWKQRGSWSFWGVGTSVCWEGGVLGEGREVLYTAPSSIWLYSLQCNYNCMYSAFSEFCDWF